MHSWAYSHSRPCGCCRPASGHTVRGVSERGPAVNQVPHQIHNWASINEVWVLVLGFFIFLSAVSSGLSLVLDLEIDWEAWKGRLGALVRNLRTVRVVYRVNVYESSSAGSPRLYWVNVYESSSAGSAGLTITWLLLFLLYPTVCVPV